MNVKRVLILSMAALPLLLNACRGGGAVSSLPAQQTVGSETEMPTALLRAVGPSSIHVPTIRMVVRGTFHGRGPVFLAHRNRLSANAVPNALTFTHLLVNGTVYPTDAAPYQIKNSVTMPYPTNGTFSASLAFSNVPVHRNELVILDFNGVAKDGSMVDIGDLMGLINVPSVSGKTPLLTENTSLTAEVFMLLLNNGEIGTWDLDNTPNLGTEIHNAVAPLNITPDSRTWLYNGAQMRRIFDAIGLRWARTLNVNAGTPGTLILLQDYTNNEELYMQTNRAFVGSLGGEAIPKISRVLGGNGSCGGVFVNIPAHSPPRLPIVPSFINVCALANTGQTTLSNVYGGHVLLGATDNLYQFQQNAPPYTGGFVSLAGEAPGTKNVTVPTAPAQKTITTNDPAGFAFATGFATLQVPLFTVGPAFGTGPLGATSFSGPFGEFSRSSPATNYSSTNNTVTVETFNPFNIPASHLHVCGGISCVPMNFTGTFKVVRPFGDPGTNLTYFNWSVGGTATAIAQGTNGYDITTSGAGNATLKTTTPSAFLPSEIVLFEDNITGNIPWTISATDNNGKTYTNGAIINFRGAVTMYSVPRIIRTKSITVTFNAPAAATYHLYFMICNSNSGC